MRSSKMKSDQHQSWLGKYIGVKISENLDIGCCHKSSKKKWDVKPNQKRKY